MKSRTTKQPYETFPRYVDFSRVMDTGETITGQSVTALDSSGADVSATFCDQASIRAENQRVYITIRAGDAASSPYTLTYRCATSTGNQWEEDVKVWVED